MWDGPKGKPSMYKSKSFSIRKMATTARRAKRTIFACARLRGYLVSLRDFSAGNWPAAAVPAFLTAIWHGKHYVTHQTPCCVFPCIFYFPHFFFFFSNYSVMTWLPDFWGKEKNRIYEHAFICVKNISFIQFDLFRSNARITAEARWQIFASRLIVLVRKDISHVLYNNVHKPRVLYGSALGGWTFSGFVRRGTRKTTVLVRVGQPVSSSMRFNLSERKASTSTAYTKYPGMFVTILKRHVFVKES